MLDSRPPLSPGRLIGLALITILILLDAGMVVLMAALPVGVFTVVIGVLLLASLPLIGAIIFVTVGIHSTRYQVESDMLLIRWGRMVQRVPMGSIVEVLPSDALEETKDFRGIRWPGCMVGSGHVVSEDGAEYQTSFYATRPIEDQILVVTADMSYSISPADSINFIASLQALMETDNVGDESGAAQEMEVLSWTIWPERNALILIAIAVVLNLALFTLLAAANSRLPEEIPLHFDKYGNVDRRGPPTSLFILPLIGTIAWVSASIGGWFFYYIRHERPIAQFIWGFSILIQVATWAAMIGLIT
jgi:hypothetical protein